MNILINKIEYQNEEITTLGDKEPNFMLLYKNVSYTMFSNKNKIEGSLMTNSTDDNEIIEEIKKEMSILAKE